MHHPTDRIAHTTAFVTPVVEHWLEQEIAQWVHPMKDRSDDPLHHKRTLLINTCIWQYLNQFAVLDNWICLVCILSEPAEGSQCNTETASPGQAPRAVEEEPRAGNTELQGGGTETAQDHLPAREREGPLHQRSLRPHTEGLWCVVTFGGLQLE